jgi:Na+/H+ antiporter NhaD/arsenite permease-like protein
MPHLPPIHWIPVSLFLVTYLLIAVESNTGSHLDRTAAAFCGAVAMILAHVIRLDDAYKAIEWNTIIFLLGIMILVAHFRVSGFFDWIVVRVAAIARTRKQLLVLLVLTSGILSAFFVNDTVCLVFTPIVLTVTERLEIPPTPFVIALATSANLGSAMSVTGNPQNALIGISAHFSFLSFLAYLAPVAVVCLGLNLLIISWFFRCDLSSREPLRVTRAIPVEVDRTLLIKCIFAASLVILLWMMNFSFPLVAIAVGAVIFVLGRVKSERIHQHIDWELLLFFAALFVVIRGFEVSGATAYLVDRFEPWLRRGQCSQLFALSGAMVVLSNLVSNVPAVILFRPLLSSFTNSRFIWLVLAASSTLAGNCTPFSSIANLIVLQQANRKAKIGFWDFTRVGLIVTAVTTSAAVAILAAVSYLFPS